MAFLPRGKGIWTSQSSKVQMPGGLPRGGCWSFNLTGIWPYLYITFEVPKKIMSSRTLQVRRTSLKRSKYQTRQEYLDISKPKLTFYSLNLSLPWQSQQEPCAIKYGGQTWLDEAWLMAEKHSHRSLIACKKILGSYPETVKQEKGIVHEPSLRNDRNVYFKRWIFLFLRLISAVKIYNHFIKILERRQQENCMKCLQKWFYKHFVFHFL